MKTEGIDLFIGGLLLGCVVMGLSMVWVLS